MNDKLKPCPFCGKNKVGIIEKNGKYRVICISRDCHIEPRTNYKDTKQEAIEEWNRRVNENESSI